MSRAPGKAGSAGTPPRTPKVADVRRPFKTSRLLVRGGFAAAGLALRLLPLGREPPLLRAARRPRAFARLRRAQGLQDHLPELGPAVLDVPGLVPEPLA